MIVSTRRGARPWRRPAASRVHIPIRLVVESLEDRRLLSVTIAVDAASSQHPIDPNIYGVAFADTTSLADLSVPINRDGGNATTRYNWQVNATNPTRGYFCASIAQSSSTPGADADSFISST